MDVESIIEPLKERSIEIEGLLEAIEQQKEPLKLELKAITRILRAANVPPSAARPSPRRTGNKSGPGSPLPVPSANFPNGAKTVAATAAVIDYLKSLPKGDEVRPIDARKALQGKIDPNSRMMSDVFAGLREDGFIRFVRQSGTSRYYARSEDDVSADMKERLVGRDA